MTQDLSPADLSRLWLLRGRYTTKEAVEKAIYYGLPLWPEAVHLARAYHRSQKDLAGGKYYIIGSEFVENEPESPYSYHELGRYPTDWHKLQSDLATPSEASRLDNSNYDSPIIRDSPQLFARKSESLLEKSTWKETLEKSCFENDKNKHIELLLGGVSTMEIENLQLSRNAINISQISEDGNSECENASENCAKSSGQLICRRLLPDTFVNGHQNVCQENKSDNVVYSDCEDSQDRCPIPNAFDQINDDLLTPFDSSRVLNSKGAVNSMQRDAEILQKSHSFDFSVYESELLRRCEEEFLRPRTSIRSFSRIIPIEELRSIPLDMDEGNTPVSDTMRDASEEENTSANSICSAVRDVEELHEDAGIKNVDERADPYSCGSLENPNISEEKHKRCYVYPFESSSSIIESEFSDDDVIGTNIFLEISEHRRQEGASSPSACSDNSNAALPPNVFTWLPQTCDVNLITRFRSPSPNAKCELVLPLPRIVSSNLSVEAPKLEEVLVSADFTKTFYHSGAFALNRGPVRGRSVSLKCDAPTITRSDVAHCIENIAASDCSCEIQLNIRQSQKSTLDTTACEDINVDIYQELTYHPNNVSEFATKELIAIPFASASFCCYAVKCEAVYSSWVFDVQCGNSAKVLLQEKLLDQISHCCRAVLFRSKKRRSKMNSSKRRKHSNNTMEEFLMLLETGAMPSQIIDVKSCVDSGPVDDATGTIEESGRLSIYEFDPSEPGNSSQLKAFEDVTPQRSDCSGSPDRLVIVEDADLTARELEMSNSEIARLSSYLCASTDVENDSCTAVKSDCSPLKSSIIDYCQASTSEMLSRFDLAVVNQPSIEDKTSSFCIEFPPQNSQSDSVSIISPYKSRTKNKAIAQASYYDTSNEQESSLSVRKRKKERSNTVDGNLKADSGKLKSCDDSETLSKKRRIEQKKLLRLQSSALKDIDQLHFPINSSVVHPATINLPLTTGECKEQTARYDCIEAEISEPIHQHCYISSAPAHQESIVTSDCHSTDQGNEEQFRHPTVEEYGKDKLDVRSSGHLQTDIGDTVDRLITKNSSARGYRTKLERRKNSRSGKIGVLLHSEDITDNEQAPKNLDVTELPNVGVKVLKKPESADHHITGSSSLVPSCRKRNRPKNLHTESHISVTPTKRKKYGSGGNLAPEVQCAITSVNEDLSAVTRRRKSYATSKTALSVSQPISGSRYLSRCKGLLQQENISSDSLGDDVVFIKRGRHRQKSPTPPILVVAVSVTSSFVPVKRDNCRYADVITLPTCNRGEAIKTAIYSSDSAEVLNVLALDIIIKEASILSAVNLATFAQLVSALFETPANVFGDFMDVEPSTLPANFTTIFERTAPLRFRHRLDYNSFSSMLINGLPENGLRALALDPHKVSMFKIAKFVDTIKEAVEEVCVELRTRRNLSKAEIQAEKDLSSEVQQLISSRYVESVMKLVDACAQSSDVPLQIISDRFHLLLFGWDCFLLQGGVLRVRLQLSPGRSHPGIIDVATSWLDQIDTILSRAQATLSTRTSAFAVSLAQEKNIMNKIWHKMAAQTSSSCNDESSIHCPECKLYFHNEDTDFMHNRIFHQKSRECEECYDMFHTLLGLDLHMVGYHKRSFVEDL